MKNTNQFLAVMAATFAALSSHGCMDILTPTPANHELSQVPTGAAPGAAAADLDGDDDIDLVTANQLSAGISIIYNEGNGRFEAHRAFAVGQGPDALVLADLNNDGVLDIVTTNQDDDGVSILLSR